MTGLELQRNTLRLYAEMLARPAARFVFAYGDEMAEAGLPAAVNIAGGTSLTVAPDLARLKAVFRRGGLDFLVTNLDEALRVLKNEIRKHTPLSVAFAAEPAAVIAEMNERGVAPHLEFAESGVKQSLAVEVIAARHGANGSWEISTHAARLLEERGWVERVLPAETTAELRALDVKLMSEVHEASRLQWLRRVPHYQRAVAGEGRVMWLTAAEMSGLG